MNRGNFYVFRFALVVCLLVSVGLTLAYTGLREAQELSARIDVVRNIFSVAGYTDEKLQALKAKGDNVVMEAFQKQFQSVLFDKNNEEIPLDTIKSDLENLGFLRDDLDKKEVFELSELFQNNLGLLAKRAGKTFEEYDPNLRLLFLYRPEKEIVSYVVPIEGFGLWDMIYGYLALETDLNTIQDIRFYKHSETPGLGGECSEPWFTSQFQGKKILDQKGAFISVSVVKGSAAGKYTGSDLAHYVDGISGGTITGNGITKFLREDLNGYLDYFQILREKGDSLQNALQTDDRNTGVEKRRINRIKEGQREGAKRGKAMSETTVLERPVKEEKSKVKTPIFG